MLLIVVALTLGLSSPAVADDGLGGVSGTLSGVSDTSLGTGINFDSLTANDAWNIVDSSYSLNQIDPLTQSVMGNSLGDSPSDSYAVQTDLQADNNLDLNVQTLMNQAVQQADANRLKAASSQSQTTLKTGAVPSQYAALLAAAQQKYCPSLPIGVFAAQIKQESGFNPNAVSPKGAEGIAQFLPGTWAGNGVDGNNDGKKDIFNPEDALPAAAKYDCTLMQEVNDIPGDPVSNMLAAYNAGSGAVHTYQGIPPYAETQNYVKSILASAATLTQTSGISPAGCPSSAPAGTLRSGSSSLGIAKVCEDSVSQARSPQAAAAIKYALSNLGVPYSQATRNEVGWFDCSSYVTRAYQAAGVNVAPNGQNAPTTTVIAGAAWAHPISISEAKPGDLIEPESGHVVMMLADGYLAEASTYGDVTHVMNDYAASNPYFVAWVDPSKV